MGVSSQLGGRLPLDLSDAGNGYLDQMRFSGFDGGD
jgi:hypothetical protein